MMGQYLCRRDKRGRTHTRCGGDETDNVAAADDTDRRGTREFGNHDRCVDDGVDDGAAELLLDEDEDAAAAAWTRGCREKRSLMTVVSASLTRTPLGSTCFPAAGAGGTTWGCCGGI